MKARLDHGRYLRIYLRRDGKAHGIYIHALVAEAFIGPRPEGMEINHIDAVKTNNRPGNLEYVTGEENLRHAHLNGLLTKNIRPGEANPFSKLTTSDVQQIRMLASARVPLRLIATMYDVALGTIKGIATRRSWKHVA
jgi:hypothetical protein